MQSNLQLFLVEKLFFSRTKMFETRVIVIFKKVRSLCICFAMLLFNKHNSKSVKMYGTKRFGEDTDYRYKLIKL